MKTNIFIVVIIAFLLASCTPGMPTQENAVATEVSFTEVPMTPELIITDLPTATQMPTKTPSKTSLSCVTLLTPLDGAEIPAAGKITFSWNPMEGASFYVLDIILPSGATASFETKQTFRDQYMEALWPGGSYQWRVIAIAQDKKRNEICRSELATFSKPASDPPPQTSNDDRKKR